MIFNTGVGDEKIDFYDIDSDLIRVYGAWREGDRYRRIPKSVAETVSEGIFDMCGTCAGGRVRFVTDTPCIAIKVEYGSYEKSALIPNLAMLGFDIYVDGSLAGVMPVPVDFAGEELVSLKPIGDENAEKLVTINLPLYSEIKRMYVGVRAGSKISRAPDYKYEKPVVFYGSSITNGAGATRPGSAYDARISRELDMNFHCLGFGGLAKGEIKMAEYIAGLDMSVFVCDYDFNAPTVEHLAATHEPFFKAVRAKNPDLPIVMISRPTAYRGAEDAVARFAVIKKTYDNAKAAGDNNVYLINGLDFFGEDGADLTVEGVHPTDAGYYFMAKGIGAVLKAILET